MKRLFVPDQAEETHYTSADSTFYNASYTKTPFFLLDPYIGMEIGLKGHAAVLIRIDYLLPFGKTSSKLTDNVKWSNFMSPSGPRLYIGIMFGKFTKNKID
jgi:subtilase family serine protease